MHPSFQEVGRLLRLYQSLVTETFIAPEGSDVPASRDQRLASFQRHLAELIRRSGGPPLAEQAASAVASALDELRERVGLDVEAALRNDPAAHSREEVETCYPGVHAVAAYRLAHAVLGQGAPLLARMITEYAHSRTGIDIHPGARIGRSFFIDHGTGVVIGETTSIGDRVVLYQGVTLGALNFPRDPSGKVLRAEKRHPTLEDDVVIYAHATVLGGDTCIGAGCVIGANVWLTESVEPGTVVLQMSPRLRRINRRRGDTSPR